MAIIPFLVNACGLGLQCGTLFLPETLRLRVEFLPCSESFSGASLLLSQPLLMAGQCVAVTRLRFLLSAFQLRPQRTKFILHLPHCCRMAFFPREQCRGRTFLFFAELLFV